MEIAKINSNINHFFNVKEETAVIFFLDKNSGDIISLNGSYYKFFSEIQSTAGTQKINLKYCEKLSTKLNLSLNQIISIIDQLVSFNVLTYAVETPELQKLILSADKTGLDGAIQKIKVEQALYEPVFIAHAAWPGDGNGVDFGNPIVSHDSGY